MKGATNLIMLIILMILSIVIIMILLLPLISKDPYVSSQPDEEPRTLPDDGFDYSSYLISETPVDLNTYDECDKLKNAIKYAILNNKPYLVDKIAYGNTLNSKFDFPFIGDCPEDDITIDIGEGLEQVVCRYKPITQNNTIGVNDYGGITDASLLYFSNCVYDYNKLNILPFFPTSVMGPQTEEINSDPETVNILYSPDHMTIENGDYSHDSPSPSYNTIKNVSAFNMAYNGAGWLNIYVGKAESVNGNCRFNIYFCPRPAIAYDLQNRSIDVFNIFRRLEIKPVTVPYYMRDLSSLATTMVGYEKELYYWNYYDVELDGDYEVETIINAIKSGLYFNVISKGYKFAHPHWDISTDPVMTPDVLTDKLAVHIGIKSGSGQICATELDNGNLEHCTSTSDMFLVDKYNRIRFVATGSSFSQLEGTFGGGTTVIWPTTTYTRTITNNTYVNAVFGTPPTNLWTLNLGVKQGDGQICARYSGMTRCTKTSMIVKVNTGTNVTISADPDSGYLFHSLEGDQGSTTLDSFWRIINQNGVLDAIFIKETEQPIGDCWYDSYNSMLSSPSPWRKTRSIRFNCGPDNICSNTLRIKVGIRKDTRSDMDINGDGKNDQLTYVSTLISFCDS